MNPVTYRAEDAESIHWVQPHSSTLRGLAIQQKEKLLCLETFGEFGWYVSRLNLSSTKPMALSQWRYLSCCKIPIALTTPESARHLLVGITGQSLPNLRLCAVCALL